MSKSIRPALPKIVIQTIRDIFYNGLLALEEGERTFSQQLAIKACHEKLLTFLLNRPYSEFELNLIGANNEIIMTLSFDNTTENVENLNMNKFVIEVEPTFAIFRVFICEGQNNLTELII